MGKQIFDEYMNCDFESALEIPGKAGIGRPRAECEVLEINHIDAREVLLEKWRFLDQIAKVILILNNYSAIDSSLDPKFYIMTKLVYLSKDIIIFRAMDSITDRSKFDKIFANAKRGHVVVLLGPG